MVNIARRGAGGVEESSEQVEERRLAEISRALKETEGEGVERQAEAVVALAEPTQPTTDWMWRALVIGLFALLLVALGAMIAAIFLGKATSALSTIFGVIFGGLIGVFVPGPNDRNAKGGA